MSAPILLDFHDQPSATKALGKVAQYMQRAGQPVVSTSFDAKVKRSSGVSYREALLTLASGQTVTLRVTQTGDVFQVLLNGTLKPIKNAADQIKAIGEIAKLAESNQAAFQKKQARVKVELPKGIKTAAPRIEVALQSRVAELDTQIAERQTQVDELQAELGEETVLDAASATDVIEWHDGNSYTRDQFDLVPTDEHGEMPPTLVLKADAVPVGPVLDGVADPLPKVDYVALEAAAHEQSIAEALTLASGVIAGSVLDSAGTAAAVATLQIALETVETNHVINMSEGNLEQAELERDNAESFRAALAILDAAEAPEIAIPDPVVPSEAGKPAIAAAAALQYPDEAPIPPLPDTTRNLDPVMFGT